MRCMWCVVVGIMLGVALLDMVIDYRVDGVREDENERIKDDEVHPSWMCAYVLPSKMGKLGLVVHRPTFAAFSSNLSHPPMWWCLSLNLSNSVHNICKLGSRFHHHTSSIPSPVKENPRTFCRKIPVKGSEGVLFKIYILTWRSI